MIDKIDHLIVAVSDLDLAKKSLTKIIGSEPVWEGVHEDIGTSNVIFLLSNTYLELLASTGDGMGSGLVQNFLSNHGEGLMGIVYGVKNLSISRDGLLKKGFILPDIINGSGKCNKTGATRNWIYQLLPAELSRGIFTFIIEHKQGLLPKFEDNSPANVYKLDHVVVQTSDMDSVIDLYRDTFNIRLALDKFVEHWNRRMAFFRLNKTTIEVVEMKDKENFHDKLWGIALEVKSLANAHARLIREKVTVSEVKPGVKENTLVCTIKSENCGIPMLLIEHLS